MNRLRWYLARRLDQLPVLTVLAWLSVVMLIAAMIWLLALVQSQPEHIAEPQTETAVPDTVTIVTPKRSSEAELLSGAPKLVQVTSAIDTLYRLSDQHQLNLEEVMYQDQHVPGEPLVMYSIDFDVKQGYPQIKAFITDLLAAIPYLALEQVSFEREDIHDRQIQSHFRFKLFLEREHE